MTIPGVADHDVRFGGGAAPADAAREHEGRIAKASNTTLESKINAKLAEKTAQRAMRTAERARVGAMRAKVDVNAAHFVRA